MSEEDETLQIFFSETEELLKQAEESLLALESTPQSASDIEQLFRSVHTIKSGAGMVGYMNISEYAHLLEGLLERLRGSRLAVTNNLITFLLSSIDFIRSMIDRVSLGEGEADPGVLNERKDQVKRYLGISGISAPEEDPELLVKEATKEAARKFSFYKIDLKFRKDLFCSGQDPLLMLLGLSELGEFVQVVADLSELPDFEDFSMYDLYMSWRIIFKTERPYEDIEDVFMFVKDDNEIRIEDITNRYRDGVDIELADKKLGEVLLENGMITEDVLGDALKKQKKLGEILIDDGKIQPEDLDKAVATQEESRAAYRKTTIRVDIEKIDCLVNLGEEMGIGLAKVRTLFERYCSGQMEMIEEMENLLKVNQEFQERVARVRMFSLEGTFRRFQRMARDLAIQQNKQIKVILTGLDTELDKEVIEHVTDPLKHLVRNCIDHGLETPQERRAKRKPPTGIMELKAYQRGGRIFVEISDDGRGIDVAGVQRKALERGWIEPDQVLSKEVLLELMYKPGFSTSSEVTEISGRGIGMDVVKTELEQLGGTIETHTEKDKGTTFILCLPLISALMEALHVMVHGASFLVPLQAIVGTEKFDNQLVKRPGPQERVYPFRGDYIPLVDISNTFDIGNASTNGDSTAVIFVDTGIKTFGIPVDEVLDPQQIIVKTLETNYRSVKGIGGATILGDGSISLVLDLLGLQEIFFENSFKGDATHESKEKAE